MANPDSFTVELDDPAHPGRGGARPDWLFGATRWHAVLACARLLTHAARGGDVPSMGFARALRLLSPRTRSEIMFRDRAYLARVAAQEEALERAAAGEARRRPRRRAGGTAAEPPQAPSQCSFADAAGFGLPDPEPAPSDPTGAPWLEPVSDEELQRADDGRLRAERWPGRGDRAVGARVGVAHFMASVNAYLARGEDRGEVDPVEERLRQLGQLFRLDEAALSVVRHTYFYQSIHELEQLHDQLGEVGRLSNARRWLASLSVASGLPEPVVAEALGDAGRLRRTGLVEDDFELEAGVVQHLLGFGQDGLESTYVRLAPAPAVSVSAAAVQSAELRELLDVLGAGLPCNVLLHGAPGTGKTELALGLRDALGVSVHLLRARSEQSSSVGFRLQALTAAESLLDPARDLLVVDEADALLNSDPFERDGVKAAVIEQLDGTRLRRIWIANHLGRCDESVRRRFHYSVQFRRFSDEQRARVWSVAASRAPEIAEVLGADAIDALARRYDANAGALSAALPLLRAADGRERCVARLGRLLEAHVRLVRGGEPPPALPNSHRYSIEGLNVAGGVERPLRALERFSEYLREHEARPHEQEVRNMNVLASGPPGTGKTEFARFVARHLGRPLMIRPASTLLSMWVGGTEKQIAEAFAVAEERGAVLLLDEADSLIAARAGATRSWEVSQVNELLMRMEAFRGILVCATNLVDRLDPASLRRFNLVMRFQPLDADGAVAFHRNYLAELADAPLSDPELARLRAMGGLVPGDFKVVRQQRLFAADGPAPQRELLAGLEDARRARTGAAERTVGFRP